MPPGGASFGDGKGGPPQGGAIPRNEEGLQGYIAENGEGAASTVTTTQGILEWRVETMGERRSVYVCVATVTSL
jgi:hypothetical protein